jgi:hypothetical protein
MPCLKDILWNNQPGKENLQAPFGPETTGPAVEKFYRSAKRMTAKIFNLLIYNKNTILARCMLTTK